MSEGGKRQRTGAVQNLTEFLGREVNAKRLGVRQSSAAFGGGGGGEEGGENPRGPRSKRILASSRGKSEGGKRQRTGAVQNLSELLGRGVDAERLGRLALALGFGG